MKQSLNFDFLNSNKIFYPLFCYGPMILQGKKDFFPWAVEIHPTAKCNHCCIHCSYKTRNENRKELSYETFISLINSLIKMKVKGVYFSGGGEPTLYPYILEGIEKLTSNEIEVALITNGSYFEKSGLLEIADKLNYIAISVPSCNPDKFKFITGRNFCDRILELPQKIKNKFGNSSPIVGARVVITNHIVEEVPEILTNLKDKNFDYAIFKVVRDYEDQGLGLSNEAIETLKQEIAILKNNGEIDDDFTNIEKIFDYKKAYNSSGYCYISQLGLTGAITPEGDVYHNISEIGKNEFCIGNINNDKLDKLWNSDRHNSVKAHSNEEWKQGKCKNCRAISYNLILNNLLNKIPCKEDPFI